MSRTLWRIAGVLTIGYAVLTLVGFSLEGTTPLLGDGSSAAQSTYAGLSLGRAMAGGYIECMGFLAFLAAAAFLRRALGRGGEGGRWLAETAWGSALVYTAVSLAPGMAAGAAALYAAKHGTGIDTVLAVNNVRNFAFFISLLPLGLFTLAIAGLALSKGGELAGWIGWIGVPVGVVQFVGCAGAGAQWQDYATLPWLVWFVALGVAMIVRRVPVTDREGVPQPALA